MLMSGGYLLFRGQLTAIGTVKKVGDRLYTMTYKGDYGFDAFLKKGGAASDAEVGDHVTEFLSHGFYKVKPQTQRQGCSTVHAKGENGGYLFGRNYDWKDCTVMVVQTKPENGYASVSTCNMDFWGFGEGYLPEGFVNKMLAISSVYVPLDGINEKRLCRVSARKRWEKSLKRRYGALSTIRPAWRRLIISVRITEKTIHFR